jgi:hypothetical protein
MKRLFWMGLVVGCLSSFLVNAIFWRSVPAYAQSPVEPTPAAEVLTSSDFLPQGGGGPGMVQTFFTYQGYLKKNGVPVNGYCDMQFKLYDSSLDTGFQLGSTLSFQNTQVTNGVFTVVLDFGERFNGYSRYLETLVSCPAGASPTYTTLPRQILSAAPYAQSLRPGAEMIGEISTPGKGVLNVTNNNMTGSNPAIWATGTYRGIYAVGETDAGVVGATNSGSSAGVEAWGYGLNSIALSIHGGIQVADAGTGTATPVFIHVVSLANVCQGLYTYQTAIDNPLINGNPNAILIVTPNYGASNNGHAPAVGIPAVYYDATNQCGRGVGKWVIYNLDSITQVIDSRFNVLAVEP